MKEHLQYATPVVYEMGGCLDDIRKHTLAVPPQLRHAGLHRRRRRSTVLERVQAGVFGYELVLAPAERFGL